MARGVWRAREPRRIEMKTTGTCPKCQGERVIHLARVADAGEWLGEGVGALTTRTSSHPVPRRVLVQQTATTGMFSHKATGFKPTGETEGYVCAACGYLEEYLKSPGEIDWESIEGATWHSPRTRGGTPFR
jgi:hypothetical protein